MPTTLIKIDYVTFAVGAIASKMITIGGEKKSNCIASTNESKPVNLISSVCSTAVSILSLLSLATIGPPVLPEQVRL